MTMTMTLNMHFSHTGVHDIGLGEGLVGCFLQTFGRSRYLQKIAGETKESALNRLCFKKNET